MKSYTIRSVPRIDITVRIPKYEFAERVAKLRKRLHELKLDFGLAFATPYMPGDVLYLSGYDPNLENTMLLVSQEKMFVLVGPEGSRYAEEMIQCGEVRILQELQIPLEDYPLIKVWKLKEVLKDLLKGSVKRVGILTKPDVITTSAVDLIKSGLAEGVEFVDASDVLYYEMRYFKSVNEQNVIRVSDRICAEAVRAMCAAVEPGVSELEVTAHGDFVIKAMGAYGYGFDAFILSGERINTIIGRGANKNIRDGEMVRVAAAARYEGYASTSARSVVAGGATKDQAELIDHSIKAHELGAAKYIYGGLERDVEAAAWDYLSAHGLGQYQVYSTAHGTGISECLEARPFTRRTSGKIEKNITHMIDIGIYGHPKHYGVSCEDPYLINDKGETERLSDLPLKMYSLR